MWLAFLDTDIAEPENACSVETLKLWEKSQSNLGMRACAKEISLVWISFLSATLGIRAANAQPVSSNNIFLIKIPYLLLLDPVQAKPGRRGKQQQEDGGK